MLNREIPYRPKLEGSFRIRFYDTVSEICDTTPITRIEELAAGELDWVENVCIYNLEQRKKYRAVWLLFRDLVRASWKACYRDGVLYMSLPTLWGLHPWKIVPFKLPVEMIILAGIRKRILIDC